MWSAKCMENQSVSHIQMSYTHILWVHKMKFAEQSRYILVVFMHTVWCMILGLIFMRFCIIHYIVRILTAWHGKSQWMDVRDRKWGKISLHSTLNHWTKFDCRYVKDVGCCSSTFALSPMKIEELLHPLNARHGAVWYVCHFHRRIDANVQPSTHFLASTFKVQHRDFIKCSSLETRNRRMKEGNERRYMKLTS